MNDRENIRKILLIAIHDFNSNWKSHDEAYNGVTNSVNEIMKIVNSNYEQGYSEASNEAFKEIRKNYIPAK
jgi:hypothetical protein